MTFIVSNLQKMGLHGHSGPGVLEKVSLYRLTVLVLFSAESVFFPNLY